jgi:hypothetical protein
MAASQRLTRALHQQLGDELSRELLTWMGQMDSSRSELAELHGEFLKFVIQTNRRFDTLESRMESRFERMDAKFDAKFEAFEYKLASLLDKRSAELIKWAFVFWCGTVFAMVALVLATK